MRIKRAVVTPVLVAVIGLASGGWLLQRGVDPGQNVYLQARLLEEVVRHVSTRFVDETEPSELYRMAIDGMLEELGDPHSVLMDPEDYDDLRVQTHGEYGGLGIEIDIRDGWLTVLSPLPNSPAEKVGLQAGDRIIRVEGESTADWTTDKAVSVLRGPKGSTVNITVARLGIEAPIPFEITRDEITITAVPSAFMLDPRVGYVELTVFSETATRDLRAAIERLRKEGARSLVLDMRRNTGGLLDEGMSVADLFLDRGQLVLETRGRSPEQNHVFRASRPDQFPGMPVVVLIGQRSASATEIVAGALQDHDRALLIGETSFGKGSVQTLYELPGRTVLKLTTARWFTPSGRSIQKPYGIDSGPHALASGQEQDRAAADAAPGAARKLEGDVPVYRTDSGREVLGGGGITPDLVVLDTLTNAEQMLVQSVRQQVALFNNLLYRYAVEYAHGHPELRPGFRVTEDMLGGFYDLLRREGLEVDREVFGEADLIRRRLANEISTARFNRQEGWKRLTADDPQVLTAVDLLRQAATPAELFALLPGYAESRGLTLGASVQGAREALRAAHP
ncbi:MAG TPA: S41 family peptidase [Longimicrobiales bacterium]|nr:S41 family peptidase [Longimicrobiales bacterium]